MRKLFVIFSTIIILFGIMGCPSSDNPTSFKTPASPNTISQIGDVTTPTTDWIWPDGIPLPCTYYEGTVTKRK